MGCGTSGLYRIRFLPDARKPLRGCATHKGMSGFPKQRESRAMLLIRGTARHQSLRRLDTRVRGIF